MVKHKHKIPDSRFQIPVRGMSLIEILIVITIFAILGIIVTSAIVLTIGGSKKSESLVKVRENLNYSLSIIERQLRNADLVLECPNSDPTRIDYQDQLGNSSYFSCSGDFVASGSARLTNSEITVTSCSFTCSVTTDNPPSVTVNITAKDAKLSGSQGATVTQKNQIYLRNY